MKQHMKIANKDILKFDTLKFDRSGLKAFSVKTLTCATLAMSSSLVFAESFTFDRPGESLGTSTVPKGHVAWEQSLPSASYDEWRVDGEQNSQLTLQADALVRIGVADDLEVRVGWDGPVWQRNKDGADDHDIDGTGDVTIGVKKAIETNDDRMSWAVLAQVNLANGDDEFTEEDEIYSVASAISYDYSDNITTGITMKYDYQDGDLAWSAIPNIGYGITKNVSGFSEFVYRKQESEHYESMVNTGLIWMLNDRLQLDAMVGYSFNDQNPHYRAGLGFAYLF